MGHPSSLLSFITMQYYIIFSPAVPVSRLAGWWGLCGRLPPCTRRCAGPASARDRPWPGTRTDPLWQSSLASVRVSGLAHRRVGTTHTVKSVHPSRARVNGHQSTQSVVSNGYPFVSHLWEKKWEKNNKYRIKYMTSPCRDNEGIKIIK